ncbi:MAG: transglutaminase-like domain-containing protein [Myxococcota bacterium]
MLVTINHMTSIDALRALVEECGDDLPLDRTLLVLATEEYPQIDISTYLHKLDDFAQQVRTRIAQGVGAPDALSDVLFQDIGFVGNETAYYDPANSLLNQVLDRRLGIPITLAVVYIEVGRRCGETVQGIGFPGHFLVGHEHRGERLLVDAFRGGARWTRADCRTRLEAMSDGQVELAEWMLAPATGRSLVARVLTNLKVAYAKAGDVIQAVSAIDRLLVVAPERHDELRDRGLLYAGLDLPGPAARDFEAYLQARPDADDRAQVQARLPKLWADAKRMN